jgi:aminopeptidase N
MKVRLAMVLLAWLVTWLPGTADARASELPAPGVPRTLAEARRRAVASLRYELSFTVPADRTARVTGRNVVHVQLGDAGAPLSLDFDAPPTSVTALSVNGTVRPPVVANGHIVIDAAHLKAGDNIIDLSFVAGDGPLNRSDEFLYTLFVPARAHRAFPCFDQPDLKARVSLSLDLPAGWHAVANGPERQRDERDGRVHLAFADTAPLPTYLMAFAAGRFQVESADRNGRVIRIFHRETDTAKLARNREVIFDLHAQALEWLERYTGVPYPWGKFDLFLVPAFQFGGMEHAGAIFYNGPVLLLDESASQAQLLSRASLIAHETAHMWFGDLVTMRWFDDVWMKEVFANFFAAKIVNPAFPGVDHDLRFLLAHYPGAYEVDRTAGTHPIRQPLDNLDEAGTLYGAIIYQKAPVVMRQLERLLGEEAFRDGMREYLKTFGFGNAAWPELIALLDPKTPTDLAAWSRVWVEEAGRPTIHTTLAVGEDGKVSSLSLTQEDPDGRGGVWPQAVNVLVGTAGGARSFPATLDAATVGLPAAIGLAGVQFVLPTGGGLGYGLFTLDDTSRTALIASLHELPDAMSRGSALVTLWELLEQGRVGADEWMALTFRLLAREEDEQLVARALGYAGTVFWRFLPPEDRERVAPRVEALIRQRLEAAPARTAKAAWFQGLTRVATTPPTLAWLERVWRRQEKLEGLPLAEPDEIALAQELAVRQVPAWSEILDTQQGRITNPDRKARFAFVRPALDADGMVRDRFFASLSDVSNRRREPWVLEALGYLHHPLRAARAERYVQPSLELLEEVRRTGDIFFPRRWLDATLGGHRSRAVAGTVHAFLAARPEYPPRLRRIVQQVAHELYLAAGVPGLRSGTAGPPRTIP